VGNIPPDLCQMGTTWMSEFYAMNALEPLDDYLKASKSPGTIELSDYFDGSKVSITFAEKIFGIPWYVRHSRLLLSD